MKTLNWKDMGTPKFIAAISVIIPETNGHQ